METFSKDVILKAKELIQSHNKEHKPALLTFQVPAVLISVMQDKACSEGALA